MSGDKYIIDAASIWDYDLLERPVTETGSEYSKHRECLQICRITA